MASLASTVSFPLSESGAELDPTKLDELAPGVRGYAIEADGLIWIPAIHAEREGAGDVGRFLDSLPSHCVIPTVISPRLRGMLERRGFKERLHEDPDFGPVEVWQREEGVR